MYTCIVLQGSDNPGNLVRATHSMTEIKGKQLDSPWQPRELGHSHEPQHICLPICLL